MPNTSLKVFLGLGSNIGKRQDYITKALSKLENHPLINLITTSSLIETKAIGKTCQPDFINAVCEITTLLSPQELLIETQDIEKKLGRIQKGEQEPRTIDIDILFFGKIVLTQENLIIPHALLHTRAFVLKPLVEIAPDFIHPILNQRIDTLLTSLETT